MLGCTHDRICICLEGTNNAAAFKFNSFQGFLNPQIHNIENQLHYKLMRLIQNPRTKKLLKLHVQS